ncbi:MAG: hypothetical protein IIB57_10895 [Planctomycetes bacterium]|nr:hypothetical protein [Planctomycetota bacterium]
MLTDRVHALRVLGDTHGSQLYAGGKVASSVVRWSGTAWVDVGVARMTVRALSAFDDGNGSTLHVGGRIITSYPTTRFAALRWDGEDWGPLSAGFDEEVSDFAVFTEGATTSLLAGGSFRTTADGLSAQGIAAWNGESWSSVGDVDGQVSTLLVDDSDVTDVVYVGGTFSSAGGVSAGNIAQYDGNNWHALSSGTDDTVKALEIFDDGAGSVLYVGGYFSTAGGISAKSIARWNGAVWSPLGSGLVGSVGPCCIHDMEVFDDGGGSALYVCGRFSHAGGLPAGRIARWKDNSWTEVGGGTNGALRSLFVYDDGMGPALYVGGRFTLAGATTVRNLAKWDGAQWTDAGPVMDPNGFVDTLYTYDGGAGVNLYAGGFFINPFSGLTFGQLWRLEGDAWSHLAFFAGGGVLALQEFSDSDGTPAALFVGGGFISIIPPTGVRIASTSFARLGRPTFVPFDFDNNCKIDLRDYGDFARCLSAPGQAVDLGCEAADGDMDEDADLRDAALFQARFTAD